MKLEFFTKDKKMTAGFIFFIQHIDEARQRNTNYGKKVFTVRAKGGMINAG